MNIQYWYAAGYSTFSRGKAKKTAVFPCVTYTSTLAQHENIGLPCESIQKAQILASTLNRLSRQNKMTMKILSHWRLDPTHFDTLLEKMHNPLKP